MIDKILEYGTVASSASVAIPLIIGLIRYKRLDKSQTLLFYLLIFAFSTELVANILLYNRIHNLPVYNFFALINFNFLLRLYVLHIKIERRKFFNYFQLLFNLFAICNVIFIQDYRTFNSNWIVAASVIFLSLALNYFYKLLKEVKYQRLERNPMFWFNSGIVIYYSGTLILFFLGNSVAHNDLATEVIMAAWGLNSIFNFMLNLSYSIGLWTKSVNQAY